MDQEWRGEAQMDSAAVARSLPAKLHPQGEKKRNGKEKEEGLILLRSGRRASLSLSLLLCFTSEWRGCLRAKMEWQVEGHHFPHPSAASASSSALLRGGGAHGKKKTSGFFARSGVGLRRERSNSHPGNEMLYLVKGCLV